jgi:lysyl-tRNA synthetase class 2
MLEDIIKERRRKLDLLSASGVSAYPARVERTYAIADALKRFSALAKSKKKISIAGRAMSIRDQGNLLFVDCADESGGMQCVLKKNNIPNFKLLKSVLDRGDFISVTGPMLKTQKGERSIEARSVTMLAKSLRPLPTEWYGLEDVESRLRERYVDLILHPEIRAMFRKKSLFWSSFRQFLIAEGFIEVEGGVLEPIPGGAEAEPFVTHHHALDTDFYLRISLELPLKKLIVGGYEKVFEIGRVFRNEGVDREHLQDYTTLEFYWAWHDYNDLMGMTEKMFKEVIKKTTGTLITTNQGRKIYWGKKWQKVDYVEAFKKANHIDPTTATAKDLYVRAHECGIKPEKNLGIGRLVDLIYKKTIRPHLIQPCFLINPPVFIEPLAKRSPKNPRVVERMQIIAAGTELGKGFSELNDPLDQRVRFGEQMKLREAGDKEAQQLDEDFLMALEYGMPPMAGFGVSERLFSVLMDKPIRETVFFPLMKPKGK